jgi:hypothetical protein
MEKPIMSKTLREQLVGAWRLVSYVEKDVDTGLDDHPMGDKPEGLITYTPDGYVSAQLCTSGRHNFAAGDLYKGTPDEYVEAASTYMAYCGPFYLDEAKHVLQHEMNVSLFPNWKGQRQVRIFSLDDKVLHLATEKPMKFAGGTKSASLIWHRAEPNL